MFLDLHVLSFISFGEHAEIWASFFLWTDSPLPMALDKPHMYIGSVVAQTLGGIVPKGWEDHITRLDSAGWVDVICDPNVVSGSTSGQPIFIGNILFNCNHSSTSGVSNALKTFSNDTFLCIVVLFLQEFFYLAKTWHIAQNFNIPGNITGHTDFKVLRPNTMDHILIACSH